MPHSHNISVDEDYINKSLLHDLDQLADTDPNDDGVPIPQSHQSQYASASNSSSSGSPSVNYPTHIHHLHHQHNQLHLARPDSPSDNNTSHHQDPHYPMHPFYPNHNTIHEYAPEFDNSKFQHTTKPNGFAAAAPNYRVSFNSYPNTTRSQQRHQANLTSFRDTPSFYPAGAADGYPVQMTSPTQSHMQAFDPRASFDYSNGTKSYLVDQYGQNPASIQQSHLNSGKPASQQQQQQPLSAYSSAQQQQYSNGIHLSSQTPYGPHVPTTVGGGPASNPGAPPGLPGPPTLGMTNGANTTANGEEISTIFVVGFPEDMQEREFQNMFTFSPGFEAATLKIPNKEFSAYGGLVGVTPTPNGVPGAPNTLRGTAAAFQYGGSNDPYNLVTVNQGGVVVDGGRDGGGMASWPAAPLNVNDDVGGSHYLGPGASLALGIGGLAGAAGAGGAAGANLPPRKQIIGFAKFRSRDEALVARDVLQGRRVDIDKGAVLKAEMAKKNLHTKRGVGPLPGAAGGPPLQQGGQQGQHQMNGLDSFDTYNPPRDPRESSISSGSIGLPTSTGLPGLSRLGWRDSIVGLQHQQQQSDASSLVNGHSNGIIISTTATTARGEEEERKRERENNIVSAMAHSMGSMSLGSGATNGGSSAGVSGATGASAGTTVGLGSLGSASTRGARERAEDADRERRRTEKEGKEREREREREMNLMRLRANNSAAFDAFHGVSSPSQGAGVGVGAGAPGMSRQSSGGSGADSSPLLNEADVQHHPEEREVGPWDRINNANAAAAAASNNTLNHPRAQSQRSSSPPPDLHVHPHDLGGEQEQDEYEHEYEEYQQHIQHIQQQEQREQQHRAMSESGSQSSQSQPEYMGMANGHGHGAIGMIGVNGGVNGAGEAGGGGGGRADLVLNTNMGMGLGLQHLGQLPPHHQQQLYQHSLQQQGHSAQALQLQDTNGNGNGAAGVNANANAAGTGPGSTGSGGNTSPQLPSPTSGGSNGSTTSATSASLRGTVDQNPPINTLYVGNLPNTPSPPGYPHDYLEDTLRDVFSSRPGYRKLCFRQKSQGPMCFIEFEDVHFAAKAMTDMSGNTLRGAVKNGIRLSYSKNPLGVRTPTSAGSNAGGPTLQQQQQLMQTLTHHHAHASQYQNQIGGEGAFQARLTDDFAAQHHHQQQQQHQVPQLRSLPPGILRRDPSALSPSSSLSQGQLQSFMGAANANNNNSTTHSSFLSSPPPRFYSTSPGGSGMGIGIGAGGGLTFGGTSSTPLSGASSAFIPRANGGSLGGMFGAGSGGGGYASSPPSFAPFGSMMGNGNGHGHGLGLGHDNGGFPSQAPLTHMMIPGEHHPHQQHDH